MVGGVAAASPSATSLALRGYPDIAGTASSLLGLARFSFGGVAAPLVGIAGAANALPFGLVTAVSIAAAAACLGLIRARTTAG
jgi:DHA1 family bicyclomycin/chloramphenicol resistance-like MFS transporter